MRKIYTKGGDKGTTKINGGKRVPKDDIRIEANGTLDELNAAIGVARAYLQGDDVLQEILLKIQIELMTVMSLIATPAANREQNPNKLNLEIVEYCENKIDLITAQTKDNGYFILPGGSLASSHLQLARAIARRAERRLCTLCKLDPVPNEIMLFINRLSDLLFVMARLNMQQQNCSENKWKLFNENNF
ncbi:MAG: cob(I)yrinic acid a,c-diamide adenosyltransferase [Bacteroidales bacterium]